MKKIIVSLFLILGWSNINAQKYPPIQQYRENDYTISEAKQFALSNTALSLSWRQEVVLIVNEALAKSGEKLIINQSNISWILDQVVFEERTLKEFKNSRNIYEKVSFYEDENFTGRVGVFKYNGCSVSLFKARCLNLLKTSIDVVQVIVPEQRDPVVVRGKIVEVEKPTETIQANTTPAPIVINNYIPESQNQETVVYYNDDYRYYIPQYSNGLIAGWDMLEYYIWDGLWRRASYSAYCNWDTRNRRCDNLGRYNHRDPPSDVRHREHRPHPKDGGGPGGSKPNHDTGGGPGGSGRNNDGGPGGTVSRSNTTSSSYGSYSRSNSRNTNVYNRGASSRQSSSYSRGSAPSRMNNAFNAGGRSSYSRGSNSSFRGSSNSAFSRGGSSGMSRSSSRQGTAFRR